MTDPSDNPAIRRIEDAVVRIERASGARAYAGDMLARRHATLRGRMEEAVAALDALIAERTLEQS